MSGEAAISFADQNWEKYSTWPLAAWDELDWAKVKDMQVRELLSARRDQAAIAQGSECLRCPDFVKHVSL